MAYSAPASSHFAPGPSHFAPGASHDAVISTLSVLPSASLDQSSAGMDFANARSLSLGGRKQACGTCRQKKRKCDALLPTCSTCAKSNSICIYQSPIPAQFAGANLDYVLGMSPWTNGSWDRTLGMTPSPHDLSSFTPEYSSESLTPFTPTAPIEPSVPINGHDTDGTRALNSLLSLTSSENSVAGRDGGPVDSHTHTTFSQSSRSSAPSEVSETSCTASARSWPADTVTAELIALFAEKVHPMLPLIHKAAFQERFSQDRESFHSSPLPWAIIAAAAPFHSSLEVQRLQIAWIEMAKSLFDRCVTTSSFPTRNLQAAVLIIHILYINGSLSEASFFLGKACRLAQLYGFESIDSKNPRQATKFATNPRDWIEAEERRKTVWMLFSFDRQLSSLSGHCLALEDARFCVDFPLHDEWFQGQTRIANGVLPKGHPFTLNLTQMLNAFFSHGSQSKGSIGILLRVYILLGRTISLWSNVHAADDSSEHQAEFELLDDTANFLSSAHYQGPKLGTTSNLSEAKLSLWFEALLQMSKMLLYHPLGTSPSPSASSTPADSPLPKSGFQECLAATWRLLASFHEASKTRPQTLENPMLAPVIFLCCRFLIIESSDGNRPEALDEVEYLQSVLERIAHDWPGVAHKCRTRILEDIQRPADELQRLKHGTGCYIDGACVV